MYTVCSDRIISVIIQEVHVTVVYILGMIINDFTWKQGGQFAVIFRMSRLILIPFVILYFESK
jgi:hypothetical protein